MNPLYETVSASHVAGWEFQLTIGSEFQFTLGSEFQLTSGEVWVETSLSATTRVLFACWAADCSRAGCASEATDCLMTAPAASAGDSATATSKSRAGPRQLPTKFVTRLYCLIARFIVYFSLFYSLTSTAFAYSTIPGFHKMDKSAGQRRNTFVFAAFILSAIGER